jgi:hypothetical protein
MAKVAFQVNRCIYILFDAKNPAELIASNWPKMYLHLLYGFRIRTTANESGNDTGQAPVRMCKSAQDESFGHATL